MLWKPEHKCNFRIYVVGIRPVHDPDCLPHVPHRAAESRRAYCIESPALQQAEGRLAYSVSPPTVVYTQGPAGVWRRGPD